MDSVPEATTDRQPMPGDVVRLTRDWSICKAGQLAVIEGKVGEARDDFMVNFCYSAFRGPNSIYALDQSEHVSCSGGPVPFLKPTALQPTGETIAFTFWRWKDAPRANGGEKYVLVVPVWEWDGNAGE
jgi:hypothetical protein